jgi:NAD(P)-dependent dehydrogenase (short-subunit alcohol dehydrogenase family)
MNFSGQVVMVAGGTGNLGGPVARAFAAAGAKVVVVDRDEEKQQQTFADWRDRADIWLAAPVDLLDPAAAREVAAQTVARFGRIDVLVNTVGGYRAGEAVADLALSTWDLMLDLNARTTLILCQAVLGVMLEQGAGKIVNVAARAALVGNAQHAAYAASKAAVVRLTESMAAEVGRRGINVNCVLPGTIDTPDNRAAMPKADPTTWVAPDALAEVILFLASDGARAIQGVALPVDGRK